MKRRVMDPDVYDFLEFSAEVYGGIGAYRDFSTFTGEVCPACIWGHGIEATGLNYIDRRKNPVLDELQRLRIFRGNNDSAVSRIRSRHENALGSRPDRVPFAEWAPELGVVRGTKHTLPPLVLSTTRYPLPASAA